MENKKKIYNACCFYPFIFAGTTWLIFKFARIYKYRSVIVPMFVQYTFLVGCFISLMVALCVMVSIDDIRLDSLCTLIDLAFIFGFAACGIDMTSVLGTLLLLFIATLGSFSFSYVLVRIFSSFGELKFGKLTVPAEWLGFLGTIISALIGLLKN